MQFNDVVNSDELSTLARKFLALLEEHGERHEAAKAVLARNRGLIERAIRKEIRHSIPKGFFPEEFWENGGLGGLDELVETASNFNLLLRGAPSIEVVVASVWEIESKAEDDDALIRNLKNQKGTDTSH